MREATLHPGDILYFAGGTWHTAEAGDHSLALSIAFVPMPLHSIVARKLEAALIKRDEWRQTPPPLHATREDAAAVLKQRLTELQTIVQNLTPDDIAEICYPTAASPTEYQQDLTPTSTERVSPGDRLTVPHPLTWTTAPDEDGTTALILSSPHKTVSMPPDALPFVERLAETDGFIAGEAMAWAGTEEGYTWEEVEVALATLIERGMVEKRG